MTSLDRLCEKLGIWTSFSDNGQIYQADTKTKKSLCRSLGYLAETAAEAEASLARFEDNRFLDFVPPVRIVREWELSPFSLDIVVPAVKTDDRVFSWFLTREDGETATGQKEIKETPILETRTVGGKVYQRRRISFVLDVPQGYHSMTFLLDDVKPDTNATLSLIVVPNTCYMPEFLQKGYRTWGIPVQLYAISSGHNWGMGDFTDLRYLQTVATRLQASAIGVNPLNALFPDSPKDASPYFTSSRLFLNPLYIDTDAVPESETVTAYADYLKSPRFIELVAAAKSSDVVEYEYVAEMKYTALGILYDAFKNLHLTSDFQAVTPRGQAFIDFCKAADPYLTQFATFHALRSYFLSEKQSPDWPDWPSGYASPDAASIQSFQKKYADSIWFIRFQQFIAFEQFENVRTVYDTPDTPIGLYTDLPVGVSHNSAEVWSDQDLFLKGVSIGAPPDSFNPKGQDWALAPFNPIVMKKTAYDFFIRMVRNVMRPAGAFRIDHAFSLMRLFLRVPGGSGAYLSYPFDDLLGIIALESVRNRTLVIGEDLGTVPPGFMEAMARANVLSFRIFHYQKHGNTLMLPREYEHRCLVVAGTHDMPTYSAFWQGLDLDLKLRLKMMTPTQYESAVSERKEERRSFVDAFISEGLITEPPLGRNSLLTPDMPDWFIPDTYAYLARSNSLLLMARLEDMIGQVEQVNVPGTYLNYPNWRYKLPVSLENLTTDARVLHVCDLIQKERPRPEDKKNG